MANTKKKPTKTKLISKKTKTSSLGFAGITAAELSARKAAIVAHLDEIDAEMHDAVELADEDRSRAQRVRGPGEKKALASVLDYVDARPEAFLRLADRDDGVDPERFETALLRDRLEGAAILSSILERLDETRRRISDAALYLSNLVKPTALAAYEIAKPLARSDKKAGQKLNGARDYYGGLARAGMKTREKRAKTKASASE